MTQYGKRSWSVFALGGKFRFYNGENLGFQLNAKIFAMDLRMDLRIK